MRNDIQIKVTWTRNEERVNQLYFDYLNKLGNYVANIVVDELGNMEWHIVNALYEEDILAVLNYFNGKPVKRLLEYVSSDSDLSRWNRAKLYIANKKLFLNDGRYIDKNKKL